jgi:hypothetical protein
MVMHNRVFAFVPGERLVGLRFLQLDEKAACIERRVRVRKFKITALV